MAGLDFQNQASDAGEYPRWLRGASKPDAVGQAQSFLKYNLRVTSKENVVILWSELSVPTERKNNVFSDAAIGIL